MWGWCRATSCVATANPEIIKCEYSYHYQYDLCNAGDSCRDSPYLYPAHCADTGCAVGSTVYKTCCNANGTVAACRGGDFTGGCPAGSSPVVNCVGPACCTGGPTNTPVAGATATPTKAPACVPEAGKTCADASGAAQCYSWAGSGCNWCSSSNSCVCGSCPTQICPAGAVCALPGTGTCNKPVYTPAGACPQGLVCCENAVAAACPAPANCQNLYWTGGDENATSRACGSLNPPQQSCRAF